MTDTPSTLNMAYPGYGAAPGGFPPMVRNRTELCRAGQCPTRDRQTGRQTGNDRAQSSTIAKFHAKAVCVCLKSVAEPSLRRGELWEDAVGRLSASPELVAKPPVARAEVSSFFFFFLMTVRGGTDRQTAKCVKK